MDGAGESIVELAPRRTDSYSLNVAIDPVALVVTECITVTSAMRKHTRWAHSSISSILGGGSSSPRSTPSDSRRSDHDRNGPGDRNRASSKIDLIDDTEMMPPRWGLRGKKGQSLQDNPLMSAFARLRSDLKGRKSVQDFPAGELLQPFLQVIRSSSTTAPITSLALIAVTKLLAYGVVNPSSPGFAYGIQLLASSVTHCRFEGDNSPSDEVVFLRILKLMEDMITGPAGTVLGDQSVCEMMETALSICCHLRMSEVLRRSAEISMVTMCQTIFHRLKMLEDEFEGDDVGQMDQDVEQKDMDAAHIASGADGQNPDKMLNQQPRGSISLEIPPSGRNSERPSIDANGSQLDLTKQISEQTEEVKPYGLPSIRELFRVLADLLDPHDRQRTDTLRVMALRIVNVALEVAGPSIANHPSLASLAKDTLCRNLFQLVRSENIAILHESLRVAGTLLATCRSVLKLQQELFLGYVVACLHPKVPIPDEASIDPALYADVPQAPALVRPSASPAPGAGPFSRPGAPAITTPGSGRATPVPVRERTRLGMEGGSRKPDAREAMVESIGALVRIPSFMTELFVNYDCEIDRNDLCIDMIGLLARNAFPDSATWSTTNVPPLCLDSLLGYVQQISERLHAPPSAQDTKPRRPSAPEMPNGQRLREQRAKKKVIIRGATKFNESPKGGIAFLASQGVIDDPNNPNSVSAFLKGTTRIDKKVLGEFISKRSNEAILDAFIGQFNFKGHRVDEALRELLNTFRLPGESALIERIVTTFSEKYFTAAEPAEITDKDAVFVLTYAIIMLNTDLYNPNVKAQNRMKFEDFQRNLRGVNGGGNFTPEYLQEIYDAIKSREIVLPEEHDNKHAFEHAWKELLVKVHSSGELAICDGGDPGLGSNEYDADLFTATWRPIVSTLNYVFCSATEDTVFQRVIQGYQQCALIAAKYDIHECLDQIIWSLSHISRLAIEGNQDTKLNTEVQASHGRSIMVSKFAVDFGRDNRAELATLVLFRIMNGNEGAIRDGWGQIVKIIVNLFINSLIPTSFTSISRDLDLPPIPIQSPAQIIERSQEKVADVGLFGAFASYVSSVMNDEPPEPNDQEIDATLTTVDCITACRFEEILGNVSALEVESLKALTSALLSRLPERGSPPVMTVKPAGEIQAPTPIRPAVNGSKSRADEAGARSALDGMPVYDPSLVYVLELATILALRDEETISTLGEGVADALQRVIHEADQLHPVALSRAIFYLLALLRASNDHGFIRGPVVLHAISSFRQELLRQCAQPILKGLQSCITGPKELRNEIAASPDFWNVLQSLATESEAASLVFSIVEHVTSSDGGEKTTITGDNYEFAVLLLNTFARAGSVGARTEQAPRDVIYPTSGRRNARAAAQARAAAEKGKKEETASKAPQKPEAVTRGVRAIQLVSTLTSRVPALISQSQLETHQAWKSYWSPIFNCLGAQCTNPCREIRASALSALQRCLLSPELAASPSYGEEWPNIFEQVLFPLLEQLLKPEVHASDPNGMGHTRAQAAQLLCKIFLHYLVLTGEKATTDNQESMLEVWTQILEEMERLTKASSAVQGQHQGDTLAEAVPESLKNVLLVMSSGGYLLPPSASDERTQQQQKVWSATSEGLAKFLPNMMGELFPDTSAATNDGEESHETEAQAKAETVVDINAAAPESEDV
ncbi:Sec7-domain-containing protein [Polychaeton citri CBS 116435]|uniref:Sec7-domain-containing protein n=1 Tax=Polychaeton citri CBS 116435 TaxID=1314669 RepID=A0A9P4UPA2_9PEZI|nr:Sec7-domain-containing protein [Polychaeton citri CBS 116435]